MYREMACGSIWSRRRQSQWSSERDLSAVRLRESPRDGVLRSLWYQVDFPVPLVRLHQPRGVRLLRQMRRARVRGSGAHSSGLRSFRLTEVVHSQASCREDPNLQGRPGGREILDPVLERMMEAVHRYEGTVNQVMGDGIMALFGAPLAHEDHAVRACYAALRMQDVGEAVRRGRVSIPRVTVRMRVGLNSGDVVVRAIGSDLHMDYTAVGQTTHLAARMEQLADPGATLLTAATVQLAEGLCRREGARSRARQGARRLGGGVRARRCGRRALPPPRRRRPGAHPLRRARQRAGSAPSGPGARRGRPRPGGCGRGRAGSGEVSPLLGVHPLASQPRAGSSCETGSVSYGKATAYLPVIDLLRSLLPDRGARRHAEDPREGHRPAPVPGLASSSRRCRRCLSLLDVPVEDAAWDAARPATAAAADPRRA